MLFDETVFQYQGDRATYIPIQNAFICIDVPTNQPINVLANEFKAHQKRGRPISFKDKNPRKKKEQNKHVGTSKFINILKKHVTKIVDITKQKTPEEIQVLENDVSEKISISYLTSRKRWNQMKLLSIIYLHM